jgi:hypothetical protein
MKKQIITLIVIFVILLLFFNNNHIKAEENFVYEKIALDQYKMRFDDCNTTLVYWASDLKVPIDATDEISKKELMLTLKYIELFKTRYENKDIPLDLQTLEIIDNMSSELRSFRTELATKYGILTEGSISYFPFIIHLGVYKLDDNKIKIINSLIVQLIDKLNQQYLKQIINTYGEYYRVRVVFYYESYSPDAFKEKQAQIFKKFFDYHSKNNSYGSFGDGYWEYASLLKKYYNVNKTFGYGYSYTSGEARLYVPYNAPFNEQFVKEAVNLVRKYTGCDVPLILSFRPDPELLAGNKDTLPIVIPTHIYLALAIAIIVILTLVVLKLEKRNRKVKPS